MKKGKSCVQRLLNIPVVFTVQTRVILFLRIRQVEKSMTFKNEKKNHKIFSEKIDSHFTNYKTKNSING